MDKDQKEFISKAVKTAQEKVQPHLTAGKGLAALGVGVLFYALSNSQPAKPITNQGAVKTQTMHQANKVGAATVASNGTQASVSGAKNSEEKKEITGSVTALAAAAVSKANEKAILSEPKEPKPKKEAQASVATSEKPQATASTPAEKSDKTVEKLLSNSVVVDDTPIKSIENKTLDELTKWADTSDSKAVKTDGAPVEEQDVMGNAPAIAENSDNPTLPPLVKEEKQAVKKDDSKIATTGETKGATSPQNPLVSPLIEPIDKNAATGLADAESDDHSNNTDKMVQEDTELSQANPFMASGQKQPEKTKKAKTGLLSAPLPKDVEAQIISKFAASAKKRKTTGLLSAPAAPGEAPISQKAPSQPPASQGNTEKQGAGTMNQAKPIKAEGQAKARNIHKSSKSNVSEFTLSNGMDVIVIPDHRAPVVTHMVWYKVGAVDEPMGKSGIAHFLEHLMFKGTNKIASGEFSKIIARNGGQDNAFTSMDTTAYHERVAKDRLRMVMEMEADRMRNLTLSEKDVLTERDVILEERRSRTDNKPSAQFREQMESALYMNHPYGMPIIGWLHEMKQLSRKDALQFYRRFYAPNNAVLVVAGDVTVEEVEKLATEIYEPIKAEETVIRAARAQEPPHRAPRRLTMHHKRVAKATWQRFYLAPGYSDAKPGEVEALDLLFKILGDGTTGRLYKSMVVKNKIAENAGGYYSGDSLDGGKMVFYGIGAKGVKLSAVEEAVDKEIALIKAKGVTQKELDAARNAYSAAYVYANDNQVSLANRYGFAKVRGRTIAQVEGWPDMLKKVTIEDIQKVAQKYISIEKSVTGELLPEETQKAAVKAKADKG